MNEHCVRAAALREAIVEQVEQYARILHTTRLPGPICQLPPERSDKLQALRRRLVAAREEFA